MSRITLVIALLALGASSQPINSGTQPTTLTEGSGTTSAAESHETLSHAVETRAAAEMIQSTTSNTPAIATATSIPRVRPEWVEDYEAKFGDGVLKDRWKTMTLPPWSPMLTAAVYHNTRVNPGFDDGPMTDYTPWQSTYTTEQDLEHLLATLKNKLPAVVTMSPPLELFETPFNPPVFYIYDPDPHDPYEQLWGKKNFPGRIQPHEPGYDLSMNDPLGIYCLGIKSTLSLSNTSSAPTATADDTNLQRRLVWTQEPTGIPPQAAPEATIVETEPNLSKENSFASQTVTVPSDPDPTIGPSLRDKLNSRIGIARKTSTNGTIGLPVWKMLSRFNILIPLNRNVEGSVVSDPSKNAVKSDIAAPDSIQKSSPEGKF